jgi:hypothetical protein
MGKKKEAKTRVRGDTRERVERNGNQPSTKTFWHLFVRNVVLLRKSAELYL